TPAGPMLMSHAAISSGVATRPRFGLSAANATAEAMARTEAAMRALRVDMLHLDLRDPAIARPGKTGDFVKAGPFHGQPWRGQRDHRIAFLRKHKLEGFPV